MTEKDHANVVLPPPVIYLAVIVLGIACQAAAPIDVAAGSATLGAGVVLIVAGIAVGSWGIVHFRRAGTHIPPHQPTLAIIESGPFRFTRNPLYLGLNLATAGIAFALANPWILIWQIPAFVLLHFGVVRREEAYLEAKFGSVYTAYKERTRRWL